MGGETYLPNWGYCFKEELRLARGRATSYEITPNLCDRGARLTKMTGNQEGKQGFNSKPPGLPDGRGK